MKDLVNAKVDVTTEKIKKIFTHNGKNVLSIDIEFPKINLAKTHLSQIRINSHYRHIVNEFYSYAVNTLLPVAITQYEAYTELGYPFYEYEAFMRYSVTLNDNCTLSIYYDQYEYTGGAHGNTTRLSDTYSLLTGKKMILRDFFVNNENYKYTIIYKIQKQAEENLVKDPGIYFENYKKLIVEAFNEESFYLTPTTMDFYYQHYDIAPYSTGIVVFSIPYEELRNKKAKLF